MRIIVYTMCKNEIEHVERFVENTKYAHEVIVTDTGSSDGTPEALEKAGVTVHHARILPWRFDHGTNAALHNVPGSADICVKLDLDEVIWTPGGGDWKEAIIDAWRTQTTQLRYWYTWSWHKPGEVPAVKFRTGNVHTRVGYHWRHPGHAALTYMGKSHPTDTDNFEIHHYMTDKQRPDYLTLLKLAVFECPCPRTYYYLARELEGRNQPQAAIPLIEKYLAHEHAKWPAERAEVMRLMGRCKEALGELGNAASWYTQAIAQFPNVRDLWWELLRLYAENEEWELAYSCGIKCLAIKDRNPDWVGVVPDAWSGKPEQYLATATNHVKSRMTI